MKKHLEKSSFKEQNVYPSKCIKLKSQWDDLMVEPGHYPFIKFQRNGLTEPHHRIVQHKKPGVTTGSFSLSSTQFTYRD